LIGEFGIPFDLDGGAAYAAWARGDTSAGPWEKHVIALDLMYNALDRHLLNCTLWNYTVSNRNDQAIGDGWNQEDLSVFSRDQQSKPKDLNSGGRAVEGFVRPFVHTAQGSVKEMRFDRAAGTFTFTFDADASIATPTEVYVPEVQYTSGFAVDAPGLAVEQAGSMVQLHASSNGRYTVKVSRRA
jgi:hypothetical protein